MGNTRLNSLPDTAPWRSVVALLAEDAAVGEIATATTEAALHGLNAALNDEGVAYSFWVLAEVVLAAREPNFVTILCRLGMPVEPEPGVFDMVSAFSEAVDDHLRKTRLRTDQGEMAELAAVEALCKLLGQRSTRLYETTAVEVEEAARGLSTQNGFAALAHEFFARFAQRFLAYHLGRELSHHVAGNGRFADPEDHNIFVAQLAIHCREAATIVHDFAGEWYSKHRFEGGVTLGKARRFTAHALGKLRDELKRRGDRDVN